VVSRAQACWNADVSSRARKQQRLDESRLKRAKQRAGMNTIDPRSPLPPGAVAADPAELKHNNTYGGVPCFYVDKAIQCHACKKEEVWRAPQQKWWYEVAKGNLNSEAVLCRSCRKEKQARSAEARRVHLEGLARKRARRLR